MSTVAARLYLYDSECGIAAAMALLAFDYCLTFKNEVKWLFGTRWTLTRIHVTSLRYLPFVALALAIPSSYDLSLSHLETSYCGLLSTATNAMYYLCIGLSEAMLIVRTYVFWKRNKKILAGICTFAVVCMVATIVPSVTIAGQPDDSVYKGLECFGAKSTVASALQYIGLILYETGMLVLNWIAFQRMKQQSSPGSLITTLYHGGMMYMAAILLFSVINAVVNLTKSILYSNILNSPQIVLHSILASRIFFNLRETNQREQESVLLTTLTEFHAAPQGLSDSESMGTSNQGSSGRIGTSEVRRETVVYVGDFNP